MCCCEPHRCVNSDLIDLIGQIFLFSTGLKLARQVLLLLVETFLNCAHTVACCPLVCRPRIITLRFKARESVEIRA